MLALLVCRFECSRVPAVAQRTEQQRLFAQALQSAAARRRVAAFRSTV